MNQSYQLECVELPDAPFIKVYESTIRDVVEQTLSPKAFAIHCMMRSLAQWYQREHSKPWRFYIADIAKRMGRTHQTIAGYVHELIEKGYISREKSRGEGGCYMGHIYIVYPMRRDRLEELLKSHGMAILARTGNT